MKSLAMRKLYPRPDYYLAMDYADIGQKEDAIKWLQESYQQRESEILYLKDDPEFDALRSDPRFQEVLRGIGLTT